MAKGATILAERDGRQKAFAVRSWNTMPEHKYGWTEAKGKAPIPESVSKNMDIAAGGPGRKQKAKDEQS
jgi:hypothetical protein